MPPSPADGKIAGRMLLLEGLLGTLSLIGFVTYHDWAASAWKTCPPDLSQANCGAHTLILFFEECSSSFTSVLIMKEAFRMFFLGNALVVLRSLGVASSSWASPQTGLAYLALASLAPLLGQFLMGACGAVPTALGVLARAAPSAKSAKSAKPFDEIWAGSVLLSQLWLFQLCGDPNPELANRGFAPRQWLAYLVVPLLPPLVTVLYMVVPKRIASLGDAGAGGQVRALSVCLLLYGIVCARDFAADLALVHASKMQEDLFATTPITAVSIDVAFLLLGLATCILTLPRGLVRLSVCALVTPFAGPSAGLAFASASA
jgi:hypothetical protein